MTKTSGLSRPFRMQNVRKVDTFCNQQGIDFQHIFARQSLDFQHFFAPIPLEQGTLLTLHPLIFLNRAQPPLQASKEKAIPPEGGLFFPPFRYAIKSKDGRARRSEI